MRVLPLLLFAAALPVLAAEPKPEIERGAGRPQAVGALHSVRQIPEACARIEGAFTGQAAEPYRFAVVRISPACQPRARFVDAARAKPSPATGWILNDLVRVPSAECPSLQAVVRVWRKPGQAAPTRDGQGQTRIYLQDSQRQAEAGKLASIPMYAASMALEGKACD